jgi:hypothetical protein
MMLCNIVLSPIPSYQVTVDWSGENSSPHIPVPNEFARQVCTTSSVSEKWLHKRHPKILPHDGQLEKAYAMKAAR